MSKVETWVRNQRPEIQKLLTVIKDVPFYHISQFSNIKVMTPRIGHRQLKEEDRTIPRICGSSDILHCIYGHSAVRDNIFDGVSHNGDEEVNKEPIFYIYRCNIEGIVKPSAKLVPDAARTKELWIVPYSPEAMSVKPERVGCFVPLRVSTTFELGEMQYENEFMIETTLTVDIDDKTQLEAGMYKFTVNGQLATTSPGMKVDKITDIERIQRSEWNALMKQLKHNLSESV